ncbi:MAG: hypothetical protein A2V21_310030 [Deltaproteobacteria bacterium GWC2_55_46]|nr:MAG: hypothetical protein A2Z79_04125 [Deltaproteobacteria bacterium GWA2_55_82]OGQ64115.1 MAG: hypothetical protein A3I81_10505 [Deltaproteobacteria bacterium RIFCSPLOWO2_02_FULL_55_12]OIJ74567.1 MAG: hypothetical protein A2V21_310030 [Deltaproteobacteria bacterium GWC2_55_46]
MGQLLVLLLTAIILTGCAPVISKETLSGIDRTLAFKEIARSPASYVGKQVVFGGSILNVENEENKTIIEVLQEGLNSQLKPVVREESAGRFLVEIEGFLDPAIYSVGKGLTVAGEVVRTEKMKLGKGSYTYPVIRPREYHLWEPGGYGREPSIGIGIGLGYTHID